MNIAIEPLGVNLSVKFHGGLTHAKLSSIGLNASTNSPGTEFR
jgi:hypothetical protein